MGLFYDYFPTDSPDLHNQTSLSEITDDEFRASYAAPNFTRMQRFWQVFFFIFGLGWLRIVLYMISAVLFLIIISPFVLLAGPCPWVVTPGMRIGRYYVRFALFLVGIYWIRIKGDFDWNARQYSYNHVTIADGLVVYALRPLTVVLMAGIKKVPLIGTMMDAGRSIFIDRSNKGGNSQLIKAGIENHEIPPLQVAPEGKLSNGTVLYKFQTGGFLSDEETQPLALRYYRILPWGGSTISWLVPTFGEWVWLAFSGFGYIAEVTCCKPYKKGELSEKTPEERAGITELAIANYLGTLATSRSTKDFFQKAKDQ
jgi:1-acyl-sn-glycerol-3-phosphate acyltransferase